MRIRYDNKDFYFSEVKTIGEAFKSQIENYENGDVIAARFNNDVESLKQVLDKDGELSFITRQDRDGRIIYIRGLLYVMSKAFIEVYPEALFTVNYQLSNAMFCTVDNLEITEEMLVKVKNKMQ